MYNTSLLYNTTERYNTVPVYLASEWYTHLAHATPIIVNDQLQPVVLLSKAYNVRMVEQLKGEHRLTFSLPHEVIPELVPEALIELAGRIFRVTTIDNRDEDVGRIISVDAWALWNDLSKAVRLDGRTWTDATAAAVLGWLLFLTPWRVGESTVTALRSFHWDGGCNRLEAIRHVEEIYNAEIIWDTTARTVSIVAAGGVDRGLFFVRKRNLKKLDVQTSAADLIYRLYPRGQGGLTIAAVNNGLDYIEIPSPINPPPSAMLQADDFTDAQALLEYAQAVFATLSSPRISYVCEIMDISATPGAEEIPLAMGDIVRVYDEDTDITLLTRVVRMDYNIEEPWNSGIELSTAVKDTTDIILDLQQELLYRDRQQLAPFNTLLSSVDFHTDGMVTRYEDSTRYIWGFTRDGLGRITRLTNMAYGTQIDIRHFATGVPEA